MKKMTEESFLRSHSIPSFRSRRRFTITRDSVCQLPTSKGYRGKQVIFLLAKIIHALTTALKCFSKLQINIKPLLSNSLAFLSVILPLRIRGDVTMSNIVIEGFLCAIKESDALLLIFWHKLICPTGNWITQSSH